MRCAADTWPARPDTGPISQPRSALDRAPGGGSLPFGRNAAGIAAALCLKNNVHPTELDIKELQRELVKENAPLGDEQRMKELGLGQA